MADYEYSASLNADQVQQALENINKQMDQLGNQGDQAFQNIGDSAGASGVKIGAIAGIVTAVTTKIIELGTEAARVFADIIRDSVNVAKGFEVTEASLTGVFKGNEQIALDVLERIRRKSLQLGVDLTEIAPAFLPKVEDVAQFERIGEIVASLARLDPAQGAAGARIALQEALSGDVTSLRRRFEIDVEPIKKAQAELGEVEGLIVGLGQVLKERGQDFEALGDTATAAFGRAEELGNQLKGILGEPILDALKEQLNSVLGLFTEELPDGTVKIKDEFVLLAGVIGDVIALITDFAGNRLQGLLEGFDTERLLDFIQQIGEAITLIDTLSQTISSNPASELTGELGDMTDGLINLKTALTAAIQLFGLLNAAAAAGVTAVGGYAAILKQLASGDLNFNQLSEAVDNLKESVREAASAELQEVNDRLADAKERTEALTQATEDRRQKLSESTEAGLAQANAFLQEKQAAEQATKANQEYETALEKINKARDEFDIDKSRAFFDVQLKQQRALIDAEISAAQKRQDLARKNQQAIADIHTKNKQAITNAARDLARDEQDIARKNTRRIVDLEQDILKDREQIEIDHQRRLSEIKRQFEFDAAEAIRANDAIAFLRVQRNAQRELETAEQQRKDDLQDATQTAEQKRQELAIQLQRELEDAKLANQRKVEDLQANLQQQLEAQRVKYARDVQEAALAEQRKREEAQRSYNRQLEDFNRFWQRKLQDLQRNLSAELALIAQHQARVAQLQVPLRAPTVGQSVGGIRQAPGVRGGAGRIASPIGGSTSTAVSTTNINQTSNNFDFSNLPQNLSPAQRLQVQQMIVQLQMALEGI